MSGEIEICGNSQSTQMTEILKLIDPDFIPTRYIDRIIIRMSDDRVSEIDGRDMKVPFPIGSPTQWMDVCRRFKDVESLKIVIDVIGLEEDLSTMVEELYGDIFRS